MEIKGAFGGFSVDDSARAKQFYTEVLGFKLSDEQMGLTFDLPGGGALFVYEKPDHEPAVYTVLNLVVADIDKAHDELTAKGVKFEIYKDLPFHQDEKGIARAERPEDGPTIAWFKDPAGNIVSILQD